jgi:hypothetical protein
MQLLQLDWSTWNNCLVSAAALAPLFTSAFIAASVLFAWWQISAAKQNQAVATAKSIFRDYVELALQ